MDTLKKKKSKLIAAAVAAVIIIIAAALIITVIGKNKEPSLEDIVSGRIEAYGTDFYDSITTMETNSDVANYLTDWGENKGIKTLCDPAGNVIYTVNAAKGYENSGSYVILCGYDADNIQNYVNTISCALTIAKHPQNNCSFRIIFTPENQNRYYGAEKLSSAFFTDDTKVLVLDSRQESFISYATGGYKKLSLSRDLSFMKAEYDTAYRITIEGLPSYQEDGNIDLYPNPIKVLGALLAEFKTNSLLFDLAGFSGGTSVNVTPSFAQMDIVINSSSQEAFSEEVDKFIEKTNQKYLRDYPDITFTYEEIPLPEKVIVPEDADNIVSLLYTAIDGVYYKDNEGTVIALANLGTINTEKKLVIDVAALSCDELFLNEIISSYTVISGLCDVSYSYGNESPVPASSDKTMDFAAHFKELYADYSIGSADIIPAVNYTPCSVISEKNTNVPLLYCAVSEDTKENFAGTIIKVLDMAE